MKKVNIVYDFDGTLTQVSLPRYLLLEKCNYKMGTSNEKFLNKLNRIKKEKNCEAMEAFYEEFFRMINNNNLEITINDFLYGVDQIPYNRGLENYFLNINNWAKQNDIELKHFILTSGIKDFVENCKYAKFFQEVFGCTFKVENNKIVGIDYYLGTKEKINKLELLQKKSDTRSDKTIYVGDGLTDYYAMKYIHNNGGKTIFVHQNENDFDIYKEVNKENIVDYCEIADYNENTDLFRAIMNAIKS